MLGREYFRFLRLDAESTGWSLFDTLANTPVAQSRDLGEGSRWDSEALRYTLSQFSQCRLPSEACLAALGLQV